MPIPKTNPQRLWVRWWDLGMSIFQKHPVLGTHEEGGEEISGLSQRQRKDAEGLVSWPFIQSSREWSAFSLLIWETPKPTPKRSSDEWWVLQVGNQNPLWFLLPGQERSRAGTRSYSQEASSQRQFREWCNPDTCVFGVGPRCEIDFSLCASVPHGGLLLGWAGVLRKCQRAFLYFQRGSGLWKNRVSLLQEIV